MCQLGNAVIFAISNKKMNVVWTEFQSQNHYAQFIRYFLKRFPVFFHDCPISEYIVPVFWRELHMVVAQSNRVPTMD